MVQYVSTPWRDSRELSCVKQSFYPDGGSGPIPHHNQQRVTRATRPTDKQIESMRDAVDRVAMWMGRGNCPHMIESTALLTAARVDDWRVGGSEYVTRTAYSTAFSRFVTGLLDGQQDKIHKMSMFMLAKNIGLPAMFVELRHQVTHEALPSLVRLRKAAREALVWIWEYYWVHVEDVSGDSEDDNQNVTREEENDEQETEVMLPESVMQEVAAFLESGDATDAEVRRRVAGKWLGQWGGRVTVEAIGKVEETGNRRVVLRAMQVAREVERLREGMEEEEDEVEGKGRVKVKLEDTEMGEEMDEGEEEEEEGDGWRVWEGKWKPRPIGVL